MSRNSASTTIVASVAPQTNGELREASRAVRPEGSWVEIRFDRYVETPDFALCRASFPDARLVGTCRSLNQGGAFEGSSGEALSVLESALSAGFDFIDLEFPEMAAEGLGRFLPERVILSFHDVSGLPQDLEGLFFEMKGKGARFVKIIGTAADSGDALRILDFQLRHPGEGLSAFAMGEAGMASRVLSPYFGASLAFGALIAGQSTAPGQISALDLMLVYGIGTARIVDSVFALFGGLVSHSYSPALHNGLFQSLGLPALYVPFGMKSLLCEFSPLTGFLDRAGLPFQGASVTIPFKKEVSQAVSSHQEGPLNTIFHSCERFLTANTDREAMLSLIPSARAGQEALVLGAGGTAVTAAEALMVLGYRVSIWSRSPERCEERARELGITFLPKLPLSGETFSVLVNATPIGLKPADPLPCPKSLLHQSLLVFDAPYSPRGTRLLLEARQLGCRVITGQRLLVEQAALQARHFTGQQVTPDQLIQGLPENVRRVFEVNL